MSNPKITDLEECEGCKNNYPSLKDHACAERASEYVTIKSLLNFLLSQKKISQEEYIRYCTELELKFDGTGADYTAEK